MKVAAAIALLMLSPTVANAGHEIDAAFAKQAAAISDACKNETFSGAALVAMEGAPDWQHACGLADRERRTPMTAETPMRIASVGKVFTIVAILQLMDRGQIALTAPIATYIPDYPNADLARKVTIGHLLSHTGGTGDIFDGLGYKHRRELRSVSDYVRVFGARPLLFEPGEKFEYSNYGYVLLGAVIERVSGQTFYDYVRSHVFEPAGMIATSYPIEDPEPSQISIGYTREDPNNPDAQGPLRRVPAGMIPVRGTPAGGGFSTVGDFNRFAQALLSGKLISRALLEQVIASDHVAGSPGNRFGLLGLKDAKGRHWIGHNGGAAGQNGELRIYPAQHLVIATLSNFDPPGASRVAKALGDAIP